MARKFLAWLLLWAAALTCVVVGAPPALAAGSYDNATIATKALAYVGQWGGNACRDAGKMQSGQCKQFVNCIVFLASGRTQYPVDPNGNYQLSYPDVGGVEVTSATAAKGDIIQVGSADSSNPLHTAIVVQNKGGGRFNVVDSNYNYDEKVTQHDYTSPSGARFWRMGKVNSTPPILTPVQTVSVGPSGVVAMYTPVSYSYRVRNTSGAGVSVQRMVVAVRSPDGGNLDVACSNGVALAANQEFTCAVTVPTGYGSPGRFQFWADWLDYGGNWHTGQLGGVLALQVTQAQTLTTTGSLSVGPSNPVARYRGVFWSYRVRNTSGGYASIKRLVVAVRTPGGGAMDVTCNNGGGVTLAPGVEWTCAAYNDNGYGSAGSFTFWADWQDYANQWHPGQLGGALSLQVV